MNRSKKRKQYKKFNRWILWILSVFFVLLLVGGTTIWYKISDTVNTMHNPLDRDQHTDRQKQLHSLLKNNETVNILLLGVDERSGDKGRSDTLILLSLNPKSKSMTMMSIPRDTYVNIPEHGMDKINHAYAFGDVPLSIRTVEDTFSIHIPFYVRINMEGFKDGINALDGVTVQNNHSFMQNGRQFNKGQLHLNGDEALDYIRMRKNDPQGDLGRNQRQRDVIKAAMNKATHFSSITKINNVLNILGENIQTNIDMKSLRQLFSSYRQTGNDIKTLELQGNGKIIDGIWYYIVPDEEFSRISSEFDKQIKTK